MTLVEIMIALALLGIVLSVCYGSSVALQRGFASTTSWIDARTNQLRVLDSLAVDLRNATANPISDGLTHTLPLTLMIPMRYSEYEPEIVVLSDGPHKVAAAGDPHRDALRVEPGVYPTTGRMQYKLSPNSGQQVAVAVTYKYGGSGTKRTIVREIAWPYTTVNFTEFSPPSPADVHTASREVGSFTNYSTASLSNSDNILKVTFTSPSTTAVVVRIEASPDSLHPENKSVLNDTVFLREATFK